MSKTYIAQVHHQNEFSSSEIATFVNTLTGEDIARIKALANVCSVTKAAYIEDWYYGGNWSEVSYEDLRSEGKSHDEALDEVEDQCARVECVTLRVCKDNFCFTAIPKHYDSTCEMHTAWTSVADLDNDDPLILCDIEGEEPK